jgi:hypothetical protein
MATEHLSQLREFKRRKPFDPVRIVTMAGVELTVHDRFQFAVTDTRVLLYPDSEPDRPVELRPDEIALVERFREKPAA